MSFPITYIEAGSGPAVIFLHGIGGDAEAFSKQVDYFAREHRAIAWNMPGYRGSDLTGPMTFPGLAKALLSLMDHLGIDKAHVVGHSIGGMIALEFAATYPDRVLSVVLAQTSPAFGRPDGDFQKQFIADRLGPLDAGQTMAEIADEVIATFFGPNAAPADIEVARKAMAAVPEATYRAAMHCLVAFDRRDALSNLSVPTLVLAGEKDSNAPAPMMERMAGKIPGAEYACMAGAGHLANLECPEAFNDAIGSFINKLKN